MYVVKNACGGFLVLSQCIQMNCYLNLPKFVSYEYDITCGEKNQLLKLFVLQQQQQQKM